ncbi:hypothetical protein [Janthinobacterium sp. GW458P]|uniref:hypothetical protein n=1 Tax=Janthinobacterium sp. GW458P TaxID=1981504 RepID=UPI0011220919|nr:hypothetical protein [Janthinobacterium sp. GW458P]MBE3025971.1 hypothetical protein [Janthinobacterium sp. GW458P]
MQIDEFTSEWKKGVLDPDAEVSANALTRTARPVFRAMLELGDWAVDLSGLDPKQVSAIHLAVILRATLRRKEKVKGWSDALRVARESLAQSGVDERKILSGLI